MATPLRRCNTGAQQEQNQVQVLTNLASEALFKDLFHDNDEPDYNKRQKVEEPVNLFVNYKETDSQIVENQSHIDIDLLDIHVDISKESFRFEKESHSDDTK